MADSQFRHGYPKYKKLETIINGKDQSSLIPIFLRTVIPIFIPYNSSILPYSIVVATSIALTFSVAAMISIYTSEAFIFTSSNTCLQQ